MNKTDELPYATSMRKNSYKSEKGRNQYMKAKEVQKTDVRC